MPLSTRPPSPHVGRVWVLRLAKWPGEGCQGCCPAQPPPGGGQLGPARTSTNRLSLSTQSCPRSVSPPQQGSTQGLSPPPGHSYGPQLHPPTPARVPRARGSLAAALPALPAQLGSVLSVHPTKPSGEAGWPSEKPLREHLSPGSSQGIPHLPSSLLKFPDVVLTHAAG